MTSHHQYRSAHIVDLECLAGRGHRDVRALDFASRAYRRLVPCGPQDQFFVGCDANPAQRLRVGLLWRGAQRVCGGGHNGADLALLEAVDPLWVAERFTGATIGSGDRIFAGLAWALRRRGVTVTVASRPAALSRELARAAHVVRLLPEPPMAIGAVLAQTPLAG